MVQDAEIHYFDALSDPQSLLDLDHVDPIGPSVYQLHNKQVTPKEPDYEALHPCFGWLPVDVIKQTFASTTHLAQIPMSTHLKQHYWSPYPALNYPCHDEPVATDTVYSNTPAVDSGVTSAQLFIGTSSMVADVYPMKSDKQFVNTLEDNIQQQRAPTC